MPLSVTVRRLAYRLAYRILPVVWLFTRRHQRGVKCVLCHGGRILLVRHTYGSHEWDLPGGLVRRGEAAQDAARREMHEELSVTPVRWTDLGSVITSVEHRQATIQLFGAELSAPAVTLDLGELEVAEWFAPDALPQLRFLSAQILRHILVLITDGGARGASRA